MKRVCMMVAALMALALLAGCFIAPVKPPTGWIYSGYKAPLDPDVQKSTLGQSGKARSMSILGLVAIGDCSTQAAAQAGGITTVTHADYEFFNILGVYQRFTTVVYGQ